MDKWIDYFHKHYYPPLNETGSGLKRGLVEGLYCRAPGFELMFNLLLKQNKPQYHIIETGTLRNPGNWKDGQSARLFTEFVDCYQGTVRSVDIDATAVQTARSAITSNNFTVTCSDSVEYLNNQSDLDCVDLFYLDSWDVKWDNDEPSAQHHLKEFCTIESKLTAGTVVAIDDNSFFLNGRRTGKGRAIVEYLDQKGIKPLYDQYQIIYQF